MFKIFMPKPIAAESVKYAALHENIYVCVFLMQLFLLICFYLFMKIILSKVNSVLHRGVQQKMFYKTDPYCYDSVQISCSLGKPSLLQKIKNFFGIKPKVNPKSFADGSHTPKGPYAASVKSVQTSDKYLKYGYLSENDRIVNGFRDGGRNASFTKFGDTLYADREVITVDLEKMSICRIY